MNIFEHQKYRDELADQIKKEPEEEKSREILEREKETDSYKDSEQLKRAGILEISEKVASLGEINPELVELIEKKIFDIKDYKGLLHWTQLSNIDQMLSRESKWFKDKFGYQGMTGRSSFSQGFHTTLFCKDNSFEKLDYSWGAGPVGVLYDSSMLAQRNYIPSGNNSSLTEQKKLALPKPFQDPFLHNVPLGEFVEKAGSMSKNDLPWKIDILLSDKPSADSVVGLILNNKKSSELHLRSGKQVEITPKEALLILSNTLTKFVIHQKDMNFVPVYDFDGNVIWPEHIPYKKIDNQDVL